MEEEEKEEEVEEEKKPVRLYTRELYTHDQGYNILVYRRQEQKFIHLNLSMNFIMVIQGQTYTRYPLQSFE